MPLYPYQCLTCGKQSDYWRGGPIRDDPLQCPQCGATHLKRLYTPFSLHSLLPSATEGFAQMFHRQKEQGYTYAEAKAIADAHYLNTGERITPEEVIRDTGQKSFRKDHS